MSDLIRRLQDDTRRLLSEVYPTGAAPQLIQVRDGSGRILLTLPVPLGPVPAEPQKSPLEPEFVAGWHFTDRGARFDGRVVHVALSRLKLLQALATAPDPLPAKDMIGTVFDRLTGETNVRFHIAELRKELQRAFPDWDGEMIEANGNGYRLLIR